MVWMQRRDMFRTVEHQGLRVECNQSNISHSAIVDVPWPFLENSVESSIGAQTSPNASQFTIFASKETSDY